MTIGTIWNQRVHETPGGQQVKSVVYSPEMGLFVAVGTGTGVTGTNIRTSPDGIVWTRRPNSRFSLFSVGASETIFVVFEGSANRLLTSVDGITWIAQGPIGFGGTYFSVAYSRLLGRFIAVGTSGAISASSDGIAWTSEELGGPETISGVTWSEKLGLFVAVNQSGDIRSSSTGLGAWSTISGPSAFYNDVEWLPTIELFVAVGGGFVDTSPDGINWTPRTPDPSSAMGSAVGEADGIAIGVNGSGGIQTSPDAITWTSQTADASYGEGAGENFNDIAFGNGIAVAVGGDIAEIQSSVDTVIPAPPSSFARFFRIIRHLLPDAIAWRLFQRADPWFIGDGSDIGEEDLLISGTSGGRDIDRFFDGLARSFADAAQFVDQVWLDIFPDETRELGEWEKQFGLIQPAANADRIAQLEATWQATGGQSPRYLQDIVQAAGFDVYIHEWWVPPGGAPWTARDPRTHTNVPLTGSMQSGEALAQAGEAFALANNFLANEPDYIVNDTLSQQAPPIVPDDPDFWPFFLYWGAETFPARAEVPAARRGEFEQLILKLCPAQQWLVTLIDYV